MTEPRTLRIGMVVYGDISHDSRVQREANSLARAGHRVTLFCLAGDRDRIPDLDARIDLRVHAPAPGTVIPGSPSPFRQAGSGSRLERVRARIGWLTGYTRTLRAWGRSIAATAPGVDVWHAHDFAGLVAVAGSIGAGPTLVYDVHDVFVDTGTAGRLPKVLRWAIRQYERRLVRRADLVVAVNRPLATIIRKRYRPRTMIVVHNCPPRWEAPQRRPDLIRAATGIPREAQVVLYHGLLSRSRGIERLTEAILRPELAQAHLVLLGYGELAATFADQATDSRFEGRLHVLPAVPPGELLPWVASADVGAMAMPHASLNLFISTPNKLFECLAAGTPVVVSDFPAVRDIVMNDQDGPLGMTCAPEDTASVAAALLRVVAVDGPARADLRRRCAQAAMERWNWESEVGRLLDAYEALELRTD